MLISGGPIASLPIAAMESPTADVFAARINVPQQISGARECVGYGVLFVSLAALLVSAPPQVNASEYSVGTHQVAIAAAQPLPRVWGTSSLLIVTPPVFAARPFIIPPQLYDDIQARTWGTAPPSNPRPLLKTIVVPPQQTDWPSATLWGPQPDGIDKSPPKTLWAAPEQVPSGYAQVWRYLPIVALPDAIVGKFMFSAEPLYEPVQYGKRWGVPVEGSVVPPTPSVVDQPSGGWERRRYFLTDYENELRRRIKEARQRQETLEELQTIEEPISREIARLLHEPDAKNAEQEDLARLKALAAQYGREEISDLAPRVMAALTRAIAQENYSALQALDRELKRQMEEEEMAILMLLTMED